MNQSFQLQLKPKLHRGAAGVLMLAGLLLPGIALPVLLNVGLAAPANAAPDKSMTEVMAPQVVSADLWRTARRLAREYKYKEAEPSLVELIRREPRDPRWRIMHGKNLVEQGRFSRAIDEYLEASLINPLRNEGRFEIAQVYVYQGRFKDAVAVLEQIKKRAPLGSFDQRRADRALESIASYYELGDPYSHDYVDNDDVIPWQRKDFPIKVAIWSDPELKEMKAPFRQAVIDAFKKWREASGGWLNFELVDEQPKAKIVCKLVQIMRGDKYSNGGQKLGETLGDYDSKNADARGFSRVEVFWDEDSNPAHLGAIVLHEVGHSLGLGHSNNTLDVMYPFIIPPYSENLSRRDAASIRTLYKIKS